MLKRFIKFSASSLSSAVIDLFLFAVFCRLLAGRVPDYIAVSTAMARIMSACFNYMVNHKLVFESSEKVSSAGTKYGILALVKLGLSAALVSAGKRLLPSAAEVVIKMFVDTALFVSSFLIQKNLVFKAEE